MHDLFAACQFLHENNIIHRDIKVDNIMLRYSDEDGETGISCMYWWGGVLDVDVGMRLVSSTNHNIHEWTDKQKSAIEFSKMHLQIMYQFRGVVSFSI